MRSNTTYEVYCRKMLICRGSIEDVADSLFVSVSSARSYASSRPRNGIDIRALPILYEAVDRGNVIRRETAGELAFQMGVTEAHVLRCCRTGGKCHGLEIRKHAYVPYMMDEDERAAVLRVGGEDPEAVAQVA